MGRTWLRWLLVAAVAAVTYLVLAWSMVPADEGVEEVWESTGPPGRVVGDAWLAHDDNVMVDLRTGKTVTLGAAPGGRQYVGGDRFLVVTDEAVEAIAIDGRARWSRELAADDDVVPVAVGGEATVLHRCSGDACRLEAVGESGRTLWSTPMADGEPLQPVGGEIPGVVALVGAAGVLLIDPITRQELALEDARAVATPGGVLVRYDADGQCVTALHPTIERTDGAAVVGACADLGPLLPLVSEPLTVEQGRGGLWPLDRDVAEVSLSGGRTATITGNGLEVLHVDGRHITVRVGEVLRGYATAPEPRQGTEARAAH